MWRCVRERSPSGQITDRELGLNTLRTRAKHFKCECYKSPTARKGTSFSPLLLSPQFPLPPSLPTVIAFSFVSELSPSIPYLSISLSPYSSPLPLTKTVGRLTLITVRFPPLKVTHTHTHMRWRNALPARQAGPRDGCTLRGEQDTRKCSNNKTLTSARIHRQKPKSVQHYVT